jgi:hypothetical protein
MQYELADVRPCKCKRIKIGYERLHTQFPEVLNHARIKTCYTVYCHPPLLGILMLAMTILYQLVVLNASCFAQPKVFNADPSPTSSAALAMVVRFATCLVGAALWTQGVRKGLRHTQNRFLTHIRGEGLLHINQDNCIYNMHMYYILLLLIIIIIIYYYY